MSVKLLFFTAAQGMVEHQQPVALRIYDCSFVGQVGRGPRLQESQTQLGTS